jgi:uncharacterized protein YdeI (YjbR/CyaY-like superfamily)
MTNRATCRRETGSSSACEPLLHASGLVAWRRWLRAHHASERVIWLVFNKQTTSRLSLFYDDALDEALCWGWIDSIVRRIDDLTYARRFTRRTNTSKWSEVNIKRMRRLLAEGRVHPAGRAVVSEQVMRKMLQAAPERIRGETSLPVPPELTVAAPQFLPPNAPSPGKLVGREFSS